MDDFDYLDPAETKAAEERMAAARGRITKFQQTESAKPTRPDIYACKCGTLVFKAHRGLGVPVILEWAELDDALDAPFGWEVAFDLQPIHSTKVKERTNGFEWVCAAVRHHEEESIDLHAEQDLETPRYRVHSHTKAKPRAVYENAETHEEDERALTRVWQNTRAVESSGQQAWVLVRERRTVLRPPSPASASPTAAPGETPAWSGSGPISVAARARRTPKPRNYSLPLLLDAAQVHT
jgi:hypothetical protein